MASAKEIRERRNVLRHPNYTPPQLLATAPNQVWSWDITKLLGPAKWTYYYLYVLLDLFADTSSGGCWRIERAAGWRAGSSRNPAVIRVSSPHS